MQNNDLFNRPASYWLRRAERCHQSGDLLRAAVLERHAVRAEPANADARLSHVLTLRQLGCYEASNREAFAALAAFPDCRDLFGLIGQNFLAMGLPYAGQEALSIYLAQPFTPDMPSWHDEAYDLACECEQHPEKRRTARLGGLLTIAQKRIETGDWKAARQALERASRTPYRAPNAKRELAWALYHFRRGQLKASLPHMWKAVSLGQTDVPLLCCVAELLGELDQTIAGRALLFQASRHVTTPSSLLAALLCCDFLQSPFIALAMLKKQHRLYPYRAPVLRDLCVCHLRLGQLDEALRCIHLCREIDPGDVESEALFDQVESFKELGLPPGCISHMAKSIPWYGSPGFQLADRSADLLTDLVIDDDLEKPSSELLTDDRMRAHFMRLMHQQRPLSRAMLYAFATEMEPANAETLLREVLFHTPVPGTVKECATNLLKRMDVQTPYATWEKGRISLVDPASPPPAQPAFRQRFLTRRIGKAQRLLPGDRRFALWAMQTVHRMNRAQRNLLIADPARIWPMALCARYRMLSGMEMLHIDLTRMTAARMQALGHALRILHSLT